MKYDIKKCLENINNDSDIGPIAEEALKLEILKFEDINLFIKLLELYSTNQTAFLYITSKINTNKHRVRNITSWLCTILYNQKDIDKNFIYTISRYISSKYHAPYELSLIEFVKSINSESTPYMIIKSTFNSMEISKSLEEFSYNLSKLINQDIEELNIKNANIEIPINNRTKNFMNKDSNNIISDFLKKPYFLYYIVTKVENEFKIVYVGSGNFSRIRDSRKNSFLRKFVDNIEGSDKNLYLIPARNYTRISSLLIEKSQIKAIKKQGFLLANIIHFDCINGIEIDSIGTLNKILTSMKKTIKDLEDIKIKMITKSNLKTLNINCDMEIYKL